MATLCQPEMSPIPDIYRVVSLAQTLKAIMMKDLRMARLIFLVCRAMERSYRAV